jgi:hypothetical protein
MNVSNDDIRLIDGRYMQFFFFFFLNKGSLRYNKYVNLNIRVYLFCKYAILIFTPEKPHPSPIVQKLLESWFLTRKISQKILKN